MVRRGQAEKGQAALEFLTTYGWALLVILVMIGALSFFGILDPLKLVPERCTVGQGFSCVDYRLTKWASGINAAEVSIILRNNLGKSITIQAMSRNITCNTCTPGFTYCDHIVNSIPNFECGYMNSSSGAASGNQPITIGAGETFEWLANKGDAREIDFATTGSKEKIEFQFSYKEAGGKYPHRVEGEILAVVQNQ